jgi:hypothetical protein
VIHWKQASDGTQRVQLDFPCELARRLLAEVEHRGARLGEAAHLSFPTAQLEPVREAMRRLAGRDGVNAGEYVDVRLFLDQLPPAHGLHLMWAGRTVAWADNRTWTRTCAGLGVEFPGAEHPDASVITLVDTGDETDPQMTWPPGTVAVLHDVPRSSLPLDQPEAFAVVRSSADDPYDALRRAAHAELGVPYHGDIPPFPADAVAARRPDRFGQHAAIVDQVRVDHPGGTSWASADVDVDEQTGLVHVMRTGPSSYYSRFAVPMTAQRRELIAELNRTFDFAPASYAAAGCDPDAAAMLAAAGVSAFWVYELLRTLHIRDQADAAVFLGIDHDDWRDRGWGITPFGGVPGTGGSHFHQFGGRDFTRCWRASEAALLVQRGIGAADAYRARSAGLTTVDQLLAEHAAVTGLGALQRAARWRSVARAAADLLVDAAGPVDPGLETRLAQATTHSMVELSEDNDADSSRHGTGVRVERHDFTVAGDSTVSLWRVIDYRWSVGEDADVDEKKTVWDSDTDALAHARTVRARQRAHASPTTRDNDDYDGDRPCPADGAEHCDHCARPLGPGQGMIASLGRACGVECYDAMADAPGRHAARHHR